MIFPFPEIDGRHSVNYLIFNIFVGFPARRSWRIFCLPSTIYPSEAP